MQGDSILGLAGGCEDGDESMRPRPAGVPCPGGGVFLNDFNRPPGSSGSVARA
jgi:hypothetical protein